VEAQQPPQHLAAKRRSRTRHAERYRETRRRSRLRDGAEQRPFSEAAVYERDHWTCHICLEPIDPAATDHRYRGTLDHLIPVSEGGADVAWNVRPAHQTCNTRRGTRGFAQLLLPFEEAA
jgi:5-methylcytosine-specific restriction endonuclease McrA